MRTKHGDPGHVNVTPPQKKWKKKSKDLLFASWGVRKLLLAVSRRRTKRVFTSHKNIFWRKVTFGDTGYQHVENLVCSKEQSGSENPEVSAASLKGEGWLRNQGVMTPKPQWIGNP